MNFFNTWINWCHSLFFVRQYLARKRYKVFFKTVEKYPLSKKQIQAIIADEKRTLVIAGAGTGKTSVIVGKVGYLLQSGKCKPDELLVIAYGNKAAEELSKRIKENLNVFVTIKTIQDDIGTIKTFHAIGNKILADTGFDKQVTEFANQEDKQLEFLNRVLDKLLKDKEIRKTYTQYFEQYEYPEDIDGKSFKTLGEFAHWIQTMGGLKTLNGENVKSYGEVKIANFLFRNGINYTYEKFYESLNNIKPPSHYRPDFYLNDSGVYIEYFGIDAKGKTAEHIDHHKYKQEMDQKHDLHLRCQTKLISLYYHQLQDRTLLKILRENLKNLGINLRPQPDESVLRLINERNKHRRFLKVFNSFLGLYKESTPAANIDNFIAKASGSQHNFHLLKIFNKLINAYQDELLQKNQIDFSDMISESKQRIIAEKYSINWKYIIIDEFQDISTGRYGFIKAMLEQNRQSKLFCVGDDWQAIYRFTGCDVRIMTEFKKYFGDATLLELDQTFRFNDQIAKVSENFILKNQLQLKKRLKTRAKRKSAQVFVHWHLQDQVCALGDALNNIYQEFKNTQEKSLLILFRYRDSMNSMISSTALSKLQKNWASVDRKTVHGAKGLEADFVVVADISSDFKGFPNEIVDDPVLDFVLPAQDDFLHSEERRLFYVALTRAKEQVHLLADSNIPSVFALELCKHKSVKSSGDVSRKRTCPACADRSTKGILIKQVNREGEIYFECNNNPFCKFQPLVCSKCHAGMVVRDSNLISSPTKAICLNIKCGELFDACGCCDYGILVDKTGNYGPFKACCLYRQTGCRKTIKGKDKSNGYVREWSDSRKVS